jgi:hypothetical protein
MTTGIRPKKPTSSRGFAREAREAWRARGARGAWGSWGSWGLKTGIFFSLFKTVATTQNQKII